ncbi:conserved membrane hypothetical protein [Hyella patelloides LEGE 07179]|uniref:Uncharacterized protein n=1 Tax=Hyella patelloides LEGE 07179 TaxID=945734 RepID=A0A563VXT4_9CYAN|nr:phosphate-starvation-inducible PsiE family protein [Hyella patelloides]VEP16083.1 conserved membrane hypothetical protein [Hyella patelloides LEGE 07179]
MNNTIGFQGQSRSFESKFSVKRMFRHLDNFQDLIVFGCCILLVFEMMLMLANTFLGLRAGTSVQDITAQSLFLLILVELFRLLAVYLKHHRIYVGIAVEVAVVSVLREIIVEGLIHMDVPHVFAICVFLSVLGGLMFVSHKVEDVPIEH